MGGLSISIILPAYNEESRIARCLEKVVSCCQNNNWDYEIIVVEDGSNDHTAEIVNKFCAENKRVSLLSLPCRTGKGGSIVIAGLSGVSKNLTAYLDVDLAAEPSELQRLAENMDCDIIIGSRILRGDLQPIRRPLYRGILSCLYSKLFRVLFRIPIYDPQCGLKIFRSELIPKLFRGIDIGGFAFDSELIVKASSLGLKLEEMPINWSHGESSKISVLTEIVSMGLDLLSIWYKYHILWKRNAATYTQKKGTVYGRCLFRLLSLSENIKSRHLRFSGYMNLVSKVHRETLVAE